MSDYVRPEVIATRFALEAQIIARGIHKQVAIESARQAMEEFRQGLFDEDRMDAFRDRAHELAEQNRTKYGRSHGR